MPVHFRSCRANSFASAKALQSQSIVACARGAAQAWRSRASACKETSVDQRRVQAHTVKRRFQTPGEKSSGRCMAISLAPCSCGSISSTTSQNESTQSSPSCRSVTTSVSAPPSTSGHLIAHYYKSVEQCLILVSAIAHKHRFSHRIRQNIPPEKRSFYAYTQDLSRSFSTPDN
jgi:hypothetical protein